MTINVTPIPRLTALTDPAFILGTSNAAGSAITAVASNSTLLAFDATLPDAITFGQSGAAGSATVTSRRDHAHATESVTAASSSAKAWSMTNAWPGLGSNFVINDSYNVDSIADNGPGLFTLTWTTDFAVANTYVNGGWGSEGRIVGAIYNGAAVGSSQNTVVTDSGARTDGNPVMFVAFGAQ